ncbi:MAG: thiamine-phosphate kinase [Candidatus Protistobacter heckmanni]|nr:thiamine-phosphate kinase [Candidatus Protistobacter heckmanni]
MESLGEFELISRYFQRAAPNQGAQAALGIGDDCALIDAQSGMQIAISTDMLVEGRHFFAGADPYKLGHKSLAVNLSDLAAMGAQPKAFTLALALPKTDAHWLERFSAGMFALADRHGCELIGGDTTAGPLNLCITVFGELPAGQGLRRDRARAGDDIWISGSLGDARLALGARRGEWTLNEAALSATQQRMDAPEPRIALGLALRKTAHAAIDVSDGLRGDLGHILERSCVGATLDADALPRSPFLLARDRDTQLACALAGGDDYELCFTAPAHARPEIEAIAERVGIALTRVGRIEEAPGLRIVDAAGQALPFAHRGFDHFKTA